MTSQASTRRSGATKRVSFGGCGSSSPRASFPGVGAFSLGLRHLLQGGGAAHRPVVPAVRGGRALRVVHGGGRAHQARRVHEPLRPGASGEQQPQDAGEADDSRPRVEVLRRVPQVAAGVARAPDGALNLGFDDVIGGPAPPGVRLR